MNWINLLNKSLRKLDIQRQAGEHLFWLIFWQLQISKLFDFKYLRIKVIYHPTIFFTNFASSFTVEWCTWLDVCHISCFQYFFINHFFANKTGGDLLLLLFHFYLKWWFDVFLFFLFYKFPTTFLIVSQEVIQFFTLIWDFKQ